MLSSNLNSAEELKQRGNTAFRNKDYELAVDLYSQVLKIDHQLVHALTNRAEACIMLKDYSRAISDCNQAIDLDPSNLKAFNKRGRCYFAT